ncbi:unnamed protein product [Nezara viridula]|uniref:DNA polymerase n=1 Tax=Nezara viridula TaxID=85310 RepID=A0A9P0MN36_NEZVI|nr:unnamed protein product [Nezara viridula]
MSEDSENHRARPKRSLSGKQKKLELLEKLKSGKKNKYDIGELENVYEEVDEKEYTRKVLERQDDDWIVDDGGCGYVEDGREIFDDDLDEESIKKSQNIVTGRKRGRDIAPEKKGNIRNMLAKMPSKKKKKETSVKLEEDDILGDIIGEIDSTSVAPLKNSNKKPQISEKDYLKSLTNFKTTNTKPSPVKHAKISSEVKKTLPLVKDTPPETLADIPVDTSPIKIKEEPIDVDEIQDYSCDMFSDDFDHEVIEISDSKEEVCSRDIKLESASPVKDVSPVIKMEVVKDEISEDWDKQIEFDSPATYINVDKSKLPLVKNDSGLEVLRFYYWDAAEEMYSQPGTVFFFGKILIESANTYVSCCVSVKNIERRIFLLPRERKMNLKTNETYGDPVTMTDVYQEFSSIVAEKYKIKQFKSRKISKKYAFGDNSVPAESEYLEIRYPSTSPALPSDLKGETFSHVFGTKTSFLEILLLERGIKGPSWIEITNAEPVLAPFTWCKVEASCMKASDVHVLKPGLPHIPPLVLVTLHPQAVHNPKTKQTEIVAVGCLVSNSYPVDKPPPEKLFNQHFCVFSKPSDLTWPYDIKEHLSNFKKTSLERMESERALLNLLLTKLYRIDPDIIVGHDLSGYGIELLVKRLAFHKVPNWSRLGRLKRSVIPTTKARNQIEKIALTGRLMCDIKVTGKELLRARSFDLDSLCQLVLHFQENKRQDFTDEEFKSCFYSGENLVKALWSIMTDASYILRIFTELNALPLALQITNIAGNVMSRTLMGGRSERNEFLLLHAFHSKGYIVPDKEYKKTAKDDDIDGNAEVTTGSRKKPSYAGGLVLDPKVGFYDDLILLMDFNSLYPSIIQEYNICFTTILPSSIDMDADFNENYQKYFPEETVEPGILPTEIRKLVESRRDVKKLLKSAVSPEQKMQYDIRQMALKLTANSMYGCLGFSHSRFCAKGLAALVTAKGREILLTTKRMVESFGYEVIYGDTDSIMINTRTKDYEQVHQVGKKLKFEVNKCYKQVELDIDGVFKYMLLLKKKKYAAVTISKLPNGEFVEKQEMKGLDIVRRDWSQLAAAAGRHILNELLSNKSSDDRIDGIHNYLEKIRSDLETNKVPVTLLTVTKQLTKPPEEYTDAKNLPHVQVALRLNKNSAKRLKQGDTVSYVICKDGTNNSAAQRAYHVDELKSQDNLSVDVLYYLEQQIHPVISRLCDPIDGIDAASVARCLGLDPTKYARVTTIAEESDEITKYTLGRANEERFKDCERFVFTCKNPTCKIDNTVEGLRHKLENGAEGSLMLEKCTNPECKVFPVEYLPSIQNQLHFRIRYHIQKYYEGWLICEDPVCQNRKRIINPIFSKGFPECNKCYRSTMRREVSNLSLYTQLTYFQYLFDLSRDVINSVKIEPEIIDAYKRLYDQVGEVLKQNKYSVIDLGSLFSQLFPFKK